MVTDSAGAYSFADVDVGSYIAYAAPILGDYIPQWYYDKNRPDQATPIVVADSSTVTANFRLRSRSATTPMWNITGKVSDTLNAKIQGALVVFAKAEFILNSAKHLGASEQQSENFREIFKDLLRFGAHSVAGNFQLVFRTVTDTGGRYNIRLPQGAYIGISFAQGFRKMFYNNKTDLLSADLLRLSKDTSNINFALIPHPAIGLGSISGTVYDTSSGVSVPARIIAFRDKSDRKRVDSYYAETDTGGVYSLTELPPGEYRVLAIPLGNYVPSFYSLTGPTLRWKLATKITVNGNDVSGINVYVRQIPRLVSGYTYIQGTVNTNASFGGGRYGKSAAVGVNGSMVYAVASDGSVAGYGVSDATGSYSISGIAPQTYTVYNDRMGFEEPVGTTSSPSYDASGNPQPSTANFDIVETTTDVEGTVVEIPTEYRLEQNYPNPFNPTTKIAFSIPKTEHVTIAVFNILGQKVATVVDRNFDAGTFTVSWNARNDGGVPLATGVYLYRITT
ncbi:MAG: T9SS type A sorting domain-containing protein, partial [Bacteroidota bacterium]